jgi:hypothetical protein
MTDSKKEQNFSIKADITISNKAKNKDKIIDEGFNAWIKKLNPNQEELLFIRELQRRSIEGYDSPEEAFRDSVKLSLLASQIVNRRNN